MAATVDGGKVVFSQQRQFSTLDPCGNSNNEDWRVDFFRPDGNVYAAHLILGASICRLIDAEGDSTAANVAYLLSQNASNSIYVDRVDSAGTDTFFGLPSGVDWKRIVMHNAAIGSNAKPLYVLGQSGTTGFRVLRLNGTDLTVDTTFGTAGLFSLDFPGETVSVIDMAVSSAGLYILNQRSIGISVDTTVLKLLHTGAADTTYGFDSFSSDVEGSVFQRQPFTQPALLWTRAIKPSLPVPRVQPVLVLLRICSSWRNTQGVGSIMVASVLMVRAMPNTLLAKTLARKPTSAVRFKSPPVQMTKRFCSPTEPRIPCLVLVQTFAPST